MDKYLYFLHGNSHYELEESLANLLADLNAGEKKQVIKFNAQDYQAAKEDALSILSEVITKVSQPSLLNLKYLLLFKDSDQIKPPTKNYLSPKLKHTLSKLNYYAAGEKIFIDRQAVPIDPQAASKVKKLSAANLFSDVDHKNNQLTISLWPKHKKQTFADHPTLSVANWLAGALDLKVTQFDFRLPAPDNLWAAIQNLMSLSSRDLVVIFSAKIKKLSALDNSWRPVLANCTLQNTSVDYPFYTTPDWLQKTAKKKYDLSLPLNAARLLIELVGNDKIILNNELYKLKLLATAKLEMTATNISEAITNRQEFVIFKLSEFIANKNFPAISRLMNSFDRNLVTGAVANAFLANNFGRLYLLKLMQDSKLSLNQALSYLNIPLWQLKKQWLLAQKFSFPELENALLTFANDDLKIKFGGSWGKEIFSVACANIAARSNFKSWSDSPWLPD